jgi:hypothetical protein
MSDANIQVTGFDELKKLIIQLSNPKDKRREMLLVLRQVAKPTLLQARISVPVSRKKHTARRKTIEPGNLKKSLGLITSRSENPTILVGPRAKGSFDGWYGHMVHGGHNIYRNPGKIKNGRKKSVLSRVTNKRVGTTAGRVEGNPFLTTAYERTKTTVTADAEKKMAKYIQGRINKLSK